MTDQHSDAADGVVVAMEWRDIPTILVDQVIGFTHLEGIGRITFGQLVFKPNVDTPVGNPVVTIAASSTALKKIRDQINDVVRIMEKQGPAELAVSSPTQNG